MQVRCPHCHNPIEIVDDSSFKEIPCPTCGSSFSLVFDDIFSTQTLPGTSQELAHFKLIQQLGVGAFGSVWKAKDTKLDRIVAIKIPRKENLSEREMEQFLREARAAAQLRHPQIVTVHEVGRDGDVVYIVNDFVDGLTLSDWLTGQQPPVRTAVELCVKIAEALHAAHEQGVVHRDLKPSNIILDRQNNPHVMDFGLAKREAGEITLTMKGQLLGTPAYMAPEQARGEAHTADRRADIYSLGVVLFELLTRELPFRGNQRMLIHQVLTEEAPSPRKLNGNVPPDLETITLKCLEKAPESRFATAKGLQDELNRFLAGEPIRSRPIGQLQRAWRWCKRQPAWAGLLATASVLVVTLVSSAVWIIAQNNKVRAQEARRAQAQVDALRSAAPQGVPYLIEALRPSRDTVIPQLRAVFQTPTTDPVQRLHVAMALAHFGHESDEIADFIVEVIGTASGEECPNIISALSRTNGDARSLLQTAITKAEAEDDSNQKAKLAIIMLHLGTSAPASDMLQFEDRPNPIQRTVFIETFREWHGDLRELARQLSDTGDGALRSGICLSVGGVKNSSDRAQRIWQEVLSEWYMNQPDAGTHSAAGWALRTLNLELPRIQPSQQAGTDWMVTPTGLTMLRIPAGEFVRWYPLAEKYQTIRLTHDYFVSDREVTAGLFQQFLQDTDYDDEKPEDWHEFERRTGASREHPIQGVNWYDAVMFCNWLSCREGLEPCYERTGERQKIAHHEYDVWRLIDASGGYRLPSDAQWEYACRAGTTTDFAFGEKGTHLNDYGVNALNSNGHTMATGTKRCNAWGLFDMHGNVSEWCGDRSRSDWSGVMEVASVVEDPLGPDRGSYRVFRGGGWHDRPVDCQSSYRMGFSPERRIPILGFRVARVLRKSSDRRR